MRPWVGLIHARAQARGFFTRPGELLEYQREAVRRPEGSWGGQVDALFTAEVA